MVYSPAVCSNVSGGNCILVDYNLTKRQWQHTVGHCVVHLNIGINGVARAFVNKRHGVILLPNIFFNGNKNIILENNIFH